MSEDDEKSTPPESTTNQPDEVKASPASDETANESVTDKTKEGSPGAADSVNHWPELGVWMLTVIGVLAAGAEIFGLIQNMGDQASWGWYVAAIISLLVILAAGRYATLELKQGSKSAAAAIGASAICILLLWAFRPWPEYPCPIPEPCRDGCLPCEQIQAAHLVSMRFDINGDEENRLVDLSTVGESGIPFKSGNTLTLKDFWVTAPPEVRKYHSRIMIYDSRDLKTPIAETQIVGFDFGSETKVIEKLTKPLPILDEGDLYLVVQTLTDDQEEPVAKSITKLRLQEGGQSWFRDTPVKRANDADWLAFEEDDDINGWKLVSCAGAGCSENAESEKIEHVLGTDILLAGDGYNGKRSLEVYVPNQTNREQTLSVQYCPDSPKQAQTVTAEIYVPEASSPIDIDMLAQLKGDKGPWQGSYYEAVSQGWHRVSLELGAREDRSRQSLSSYSIECLHFDLDLPGRYKSESAFRIDDVKFWSKSSLQNLEDAGASRISLVGAEFRTGNWNPRLVDLRTAQTEGIPVGAGSNLEFLNFWVAVPDEDTTRTVQMQVYADAQLEDLVGETVSQTVRSGVHALDRLMIEAPNVYTWTVPSNWANGSLYLVTKTHRGKEHWLENVTEIRLTGSGTAWLRPLPYVSLSSITYQVNDEPLQTMDAASAIDAGIIADPGDRVAITQIKYRVSDNASSSDPAACVKATGFVTDEGYRSQVESECLPLNAPWGILRNIDLPKLTWKIEENDDTLVLSLSTKEQVILDRLILELIAKPDAPSPTPTPPPTPSAPTLDPTITDPKAGDVVPWDIPVEGTYPAGLNEDIWVFVYTTGRFYPQSPSDTEPARITGNVWKGRAKVGSGSEGVDVESKIELVIGTATKEASAELSGRLADWIPTGRFPGLAESELPDGLRLVESSWITVVRCEGETSCK